MRTLERICAMRAARPIARLLQSLLIVLSVFLGGCASIVIHDRPILDSFSPDIVPGTTPPPREAVALIQAGVALDRSNPPWAIAYFRDAALKALPYVMNEGVSPELDIAYSRGAQGTYRRAIEYALETAHRQARIDRVHWTEVLAQAGIRVEGDVCLYETSMWQEILPARRFEVKGFRHRIGQGGIGAPVVAHRIRSKGQGEADTETSGGLVDPSEAHFPKRLFRSASAVLRPGTGPKDPIAVLELHDPVREPRTQWRPSPNVPSFPLAYDMTVAVGRQFHDTNLNLIGALGVLNPSEYNSRTGIYMVDPYEPGKIQVVFVHGLMSSPEAWMNAMND